MDLVWRPMSPSDVADWAALTAAAEAVDRTGEHHDEEELAEALTDPLLELDSDSIAGYDGQHMVTCGRVHRRTTARDVDRVQVGGTVHPDYRRRGIGSRLVEWMTRRAGQVHAETFPDMPGEVNLSCESSNTGNIALAEAAGFRPARWFFIMRRDLDEPIDPVPEPRGLRLVGYHDQYDEAVRHAYNEAFTDHWGSSEVPQDVWRRWVTGARSFRPDLSFLLLDGDNGDGAARVAAFLLSDYFESDTAANGVAEGWVGNVGTRRAWRRQGAAGTLLARAMIAYRQQGFDLASLGVDADNPTGALGVYQRCGFQTERRVITYAKPIPDR